MRYVIRAVDRAGTPWSVCETAFGDSVLDILDGLRLKERASKGGRVYWVEERDDPEAGDVEDKILEEQYARKSRS